ncbi:interleukin-5 receptor subunit alpha-like [Cheilinus undulatus]|uniref:interleukin-5 receptor subunit alpha-like n=1 Tax=Cheilinus undulatus TaxID=241271 RepID=UPI001BD6B2BB|nr:interleukin-5 receptor subunit alpha-like [Cheilinus undulatus]
MELFPILPVLWIGLLSLPSSQTGTEAEHTDLCQDESLESGDLIVDGPSVQNPNFTMGAVVDERNFPCFLYPTNLLNCSWSFSTLQEDAQLSVDLRICDNNTEDPSLNHLSEKRVGSLSVPVFPHEHLYVIFKFNITLNDKRTVYFYKYDMWMLEVLSPPHNITAFINDGGLQVAWSNPKSWTNPSLHCFQYQLDIGDQERPRNFTGKLSHMEPNADPSHTYRVRMRTRLSDGCAENSQWSDWSHIVTVERTDKLNLLVIIFISLGLPMILLAVLLLLRHQRVYEVLFPPIPRPPQKYKGFLEKSDTFNVFQSALSAEPVEEITEVEDAGQTPDNL